MPDLEGYERTEIDNKLITVYGDYIHNNSGAHMHGGIEDDVQWQGLWKRVTDLPSQGYELPKGSVGRSFLEELSTIIEGIKKRHWNSERMVVFCTVSGSKAIRQRITDRIKLWKEGEWEALVEDTVLTNTRQRAGDSNATEEQIRSTYCRLLHQGKVREAVRYLTGRVKGGVLSPHDIDAKTNQPVHMALNDKHPAPGKVDLTAFPEYDSTPAAIPLSITELTVGQVVKRMGGAGGPGGVDSYAWSDWLLRYGETSRRLRKAIAEMTLWLSNHSPPWAAYRSLAAGRIIALDKCPGVRPVGVGETLYRLMAKVVLEVAGQEATAACGVKQLCGGLKSGIEGGIHAMCDQWAAVGEKSEWGAVLVDARNAFNEVFRAPMLWNVRHLWPSGSRFAFNMYKHHRILVMRGWDSYLYSREGVTQGDPLAMLLYAIALLPMIDALEDWLAEDRRTYDNLIDWEETDIGWVEDILRDDDWDDWTSTSGHTTDQSDSDSEIVIPYHSSCPLYGSVYSHLGFSLNPTENEQPPTPPPSSPSPLTKANQYWYADDSSIVGEWRVIKGWIQVLVEIGPKIGYFPEPSKSLLIVSPEQVEAAEQYFSEEKFEVITGARYLGGFLGRRVDAELYLLNKVEEWIEGARAMTKVAWREPQAAFSGYTRSLQCEWEYVMRVIPDCAKLFNPLADVIKHELIPALFGFEAVPKWLSDVAGLPVKWGGMSIRDPELWSDEAYRTSSACTAHLKASLLGDRSSFSLNTHDQLMVKGKAERATRVTTMCSALLQETIQKHGLDTGKVRALTRGRETGAWLSAIPRTRDATILSSTEYRDGLSMRYRHTPLHLPPHCDGCGQRTNLDHALNCHVGGNVIIRHNEVRDAVGSIAAMCFSPSSVRTEPRIHIGCRTEEREKENGEKLPNTPSTPTQSNDSETLESNDDEEGEGSTFSQGLGHNERGDLLIRGLWEPQTDCILDIRLTDTDLRSQRSTEPMKVLKRHEQSKKNKYLKACLAQRRHFTPFVVSPDGLVGREAMSTLKRLARALASRWDQNYSVILGYIKTRLGISILRAAHHSISGSRVPAREMSFRGNGFEDGAGILVQHSQFD